MVDLADLVSTAARDLRAEYKSTEMTFPWVIGFSGGKDSTMLLHLVFEALLSISPSDRKRKVYVACNDTQVESPMVAEHVRASLQAVEEGAEALGLPVSVHRTKPDQNQTFWVNLLGRGYPAPNRTFRWCTDRMKIRPTGKLLRELVEQHGGVVLLLGVRKAESTTRARTIENHSIDGSRYNPHGSVGGCLVYNPIVELSDDNVWTFLLQKRPPWGGRHDRLVTLYRNALGGECPFVVDNDDSPSCGTSSPRFGCWTCTVVKKDKSLLGLADALDDDRLHALAEFRDRIREISDNPAYRCQVRRNGLPGLGPLTYEAREMLLRELLELQAETGLQLIDELETEEVRRTVEDDRRKDVVREADRLVEMLGGEP